MSTEVEQLQNFIRHIDLCNAKRDQWEIFAAARDLKAAERQNSEILAAEHALKAAGESVAIILEKVGENSTKLLETCQAPAGMAWAFEWYGLRLQISRAIAALMAREAISREPTAPAVEALPDDPGMVTVTEAANGTGVDKPTITKLANDRKIRSIGKGHERRVSAVDILRHKAAADKRRLQ